MLELLDTLPDDNSEEESSLDGQDYLDEDDYDMLSDEEDEPAATAVVVLPQQRVSTSKPSACFFADHDFETLPDADPEPTLPTAVHSPPLTLRVKRSAQPVDLPVLPVDNKAVDVSQKPTVVIDVDSIPKPVATPIVPLVVHKPPPPPKRKPTKGKKLAVLPAGQRTIASMMWIRKPPPPIAEIPTTAQVIPEVSAAAPIAPEACPEVSVIIPEAFSAPIAEACPAPTLVEVSPPDVEPPPASPAANASIPAVLIEAAAPLCSIHSLTEEELARTWPLNEFLAAKRVALARTFSHVVRTELQRDISQIENQIVTMINTFK
jgi:hypothetical protein